MTRITGRGDLHGCTRVPSSFSPTQGTRRYEPQTCPTNGAVHKFSGAASRNFHPNLMKRTGANEWPRLLAGRCPGTPRPEGSAVFIVFPVLRAAPADNGNGSRAYSPPLQVSNERPCLQFACGTAVFWKAAAKSSARLHSPLLIRRGEDLQVCPASCRNSVFWKHSTRLVLARL